MDFYSRTLHWWFICNNGWSKIIAHNPGQSLSRPIKHTHMCNANAPLGGWLGNQLIPATERKHCLTNVFLFCGQVIKYTHRLAQVCVCTCVPERESERDILCAPNTQSYAEDFWHHALAEWVYLGSGLQQQQFWFKMDHVQLLHRCQVFVEVLSEEPKSLMSDKWWNPDEQQRDFSAFELQGNKVDHFWDLKVTGRAWTPLFPILFCQPVQELGPELK